MLISPKVKNSHENTTNRDKINSVFQVSRYFKVQAHIMIVVIWLKTDRIISHGPQSMTLARYSSVRSLPSPTPRSPATPPRGSWIRKWRWRATRGSWWSRMRAPRPTASWPIASQGLRREGRSACGTSPTRPALRTLQYRSVRTVSQSSRAALVNWDTLRKRFCVYWYDTPWNRSCEILWIAKANSQTNIL